MEVQSNNIAASLFDGLAQSQQTQGTTTNNDLFSKMMDRMLADAAARKREQAADAARDTAKDAAKDAREARDAQAAESRRRQPVRAEPKPDLNRDRSPLASRPADAARTPEPKAAGTEGGDRNVRVEDDDRRPAKTEKPKEPSKADGARADGAKAGTAKTAAAKTDGSGAADADTATASAEDAGTAPTEAAGDRDRDGDRTVEDAAAQEQATAQPADQPLPVAQPLPPQPLPQSSDLILAGLMPVGQATKDAADMAGGGGDAAASSGAAGNGVAGVLDPATQLAQAQAAAAGPVAGGPAGASVAAGEAAKPAGKPGDAAQAADTAQADAGTEALPTDEDAALPDRFADLLAAAKTKTGEAKANGKHAGTEGGNRNDAQPQAPALPQQPIPLAAPAAKATEAIATAVAGGATKTLESVEGVGGAGASGTAAASPHLHPALAAMENIHSSLPGIDQPQAAATLRPSRGAGMPMGVHDQIAVHIKKNVGDEVDQFTINLHPAELGRIDIKLDIAADGRVNAMVAVEKAQTLELLQRDSRSLERALQDAGLQTDSSSLNFSLRGEGNPFAGDGRGDGKGNGSGRRGRGFGGDGDDDAADGAVYTATLGNGRVDIRA